MPGGNRLQELIVHRLAAHQGVQRRRLDAHGGSDIAHLLAEPQWEAALELHGRAAGRTEKRQTAAIAQLVAHHDQGQGLVGREVGGRQQARPKDAVLLVLLVEDQRHARFTQQIQVAERRAAADAALLRQGLSVVSPSSLKQADQLQEAMDPLDIHACRSLLQ